MYKIIGVCAVATGALVYGWLIDGYLSVQEKVSIAFPPNAEVRIALESLKAMPSNEATQAVFDKSYESRLNLRAMTCTQDLLISRFDSIKKIKTLPINRDCLKEQDEQLLEFIGIRQVAVRFSQSPLRPLAELGAPALIQADEGIEVYNGVAASMAGVLVLRGTRGEFVSVEIPSGKKISSLPTIPEASQSNVSVSQNGRITAIPISNRELIFIDNETGEKLWTAKNFSQVLAWIPQISVAIVKDSKNGGQSQIDFQSGKIKPYPVSVDNPTWGLNLSDSPSTIIIGSSREFSVIENVRSPQGVEGSEVKNIRIKSGRGVTSSAPTLMLNKKAIFFVSSRDLMLVDLATGNETVWETGDLLTNQYAKLTEQTLLVDSYGTHTSGSNGMKPFSFNVQDGTLTEVKNEEAKSGIIYELQGRTGFMRRGYKKVWVGQDLQLGETATLASFVEARNLEKQLALLEAQERIIESGGSYPYRGYPVAEAAPSAATEVFPVESLEFEARKIELTRKREAQLGSLENVEVHALGLYQGCSSRPRNSMCPVTVKVKKSVKPLVLVLSSYESVRWTLVREPGANLRAVIVTGYNPSEVVGQGSARVVVRQHGPYAYKRESREFIALNNEALMWTGKSISKFQGAYESHSLEVGQ